MIDSAVIKQIYQGDGETTQFPFQFPFADATHVKVALYTIATGTETKLTSDYYVDENASKVIYPGYPPGEAPASSEQPPVLTSAQKIIIYRETPVTQKEDLGEKHPLTIIEDMVDKNTMILQETKEKIGRAVLVGMGSNTKPEDLMTELKEDVLAADASKTAAAESAREAKASETAAQESEEAAAGSAEEAQNAVQEAKDIAKVFGVAGEPYDPAKTYNLPDIVITPDGVAWRCLRTSTGEYPETSSKWVQVALAQGETFEYDDNGYIVPREYAQSSSMWEIDSNEYIVPQEVVRI